MESDLLGSFDRTCGRFRLVLATGFDPAEALPDTGLVRGDTLA